MHAYVHSNEQDAAAATLPIESEELAQVVRRSWTPIARQALVPGRTLDVTLPGSRTSEQVVWLINAKLTLPIHRQRTTSALRAYCHLHIRPSHYPTGDTARDRPILAPSQGLKCEAGDGSGCLLMLLISSTISASRYKAETRT